MSVLSPLGSIRCLISLKCALEMVLPPVFSFNSFSDHYPLLGQRRRALLICDEEEEEEEAKLEQRRYSTTKDDGCKMCRSNVASGSVKWNV